MSEESSRGSSEYAKKGVPETVKDRLLGWKEYRRASKELKGVMGKVERSFFEQTHDDQGNEIPEQAYIAGLHIGGALNQEETQQLARQFVENLTTKLGIALDPTWDQVDAAWGAGTVDGLVHYPIVDIPEVAYQTTGMSEAQTKSLQKTKGWISRRSGGVTAQILFSPAQGGVQMGISEGTIPEGMIMEDNPDTRVQISFGQGFRNQRETAQNFFNALIQTDVLQQRRAGLPTHESLQQLPSPQE